MLRRDDWLTCGLLRDGRAGPPGAEGRAWSEAKGPREEVRGRADWAVRGGLRGRTRTRPKAGKCFICASPTTRRRTASRRASTGTQSTSQDTRTKTGISGRRTRSSTPTTVVGYHKRAASTRGGTWDSKGATTDARESLRRPRRRLLPTTADEYLSFYRFIGEYAGTGKMIRQRCEKNDMHVIKSAAMPGFFLVGENGSIVNGGQTKRVSTHRDIKLGARQLPTPSCPSTSPRSHAAAREAGAGLWRAGSDSVSREHPRPHRGREPSPHHIMVNPADGSLSVPYYSPEYGWVGTFDSFPEAARAREGFRAAAST